MYDLAAGAVESTSAADHASAEQEASHATKRSRPNPRTSPPFNSPSHSDAEEAPSDVKTTPGQQPGEPQSAPPSRWGWPLSWASPLFGRAAGVADDATSSPAPAKSPREGNLRFAEGRKEAGPTKLRLPKTRRASATGRKTRDGKQKPVKKKRVVTKQSKPNGTTGEERSDSGGAMPPVEEGTADKDKDLCHAEGRTAPNDITPEGAATSSAQKAGTKLPKEQRRFGKGRPRKQKESKAHQAPQPDRHRISRPAVSAKEDDDSEAELNEAVTPAPGRRSSRMAAAASTRKTAALLAAQRHRAAANSTMTALESSDSQTSDGEQKDSVADLPPSRRVTPRRAQRPTRSEPPPLPQSPPHSTSEGPLVESSKPGSTRGSSRRRHSRMKKRVEELLDDAREFEQQPLPDHDNQSPPQESGRLRSTHYALRREPSVDYTQ